MVGAYSLPAFPPTSCNEGRTSSLQITGQSLTGLALLVLYMFYCPLLIPRSAYHGQPPILTCPLGVRQVWANPLRHYRFIGSVPSSQYD